MYKKGRGGVGEKNVKARRLFQNTNCDWERIIITNKIEKVDRRIPSFYQIVTGKMGEGRAGSNIPPPL